MKKRYWSIVMAVVAFGCASAQANNLLLNGSFELDSPTTGTTAPTNWNMTGYRGIVSAGYANGSTDGTNAMVFDNGTGSSTPPSGTHSAKIWQTVPTKPGKTYKLSFDWGAYHSSAYPQKLLVQVIGFASLVSNVYPAVGNDSPWTVWHSHVVGFVADSNHTTIVFADATDNGEVGSADGLLDNVVLVEEQFRVFNVDFSVNNPGSGGYTGFGAAPHGGTNWNNWAPGPKWDHNFSTPPFTATLTNLTDSYGFPGEVDLTLELFRPYDVGSSQGGMDAAVAPALMSDFFISSNVNDTAALTISGLDPTAIYDLYFYAQNGAYSNAITMFTVGSATKGVTNTVNASSFIEGENYVRFQSVKPNGSGQITGSAVTGLPGVNWVSWNGLQILEQPRPPEGMMIMIR